MNSLRFATFLLILPTISAVAAITGYSDKNTFVAATGSLDITGPLPNLGARGQTVTTIGQVTFHPLSGHGLHVGTWTNLLAGNDIAIDDTENINVTFPASFAFGFDFAEPSGGGVDSTFTVTLLAGSTQVGQVTFNAPNDTAAFVGFSSDVAFDQAQIRETAGGIDDEFFGHFYLGNNPPNVTTSPNIPIHPRWTYLRTAQDPDAIDPTPYPLAANGIAPGDWLYIERSGRFRFSEAEATEEGRTVIAVFSTSNTLLPSPGNPEPNRVTGAIPLTGPPLGASAIVTANTIRGNAGLGFPTDISSDFVADRAMVQVPAGAVYFFLCGHDVFYGDNLDDADLTDGITTSDFQVKITRIRNTTLDSDNDGQTDFDEIRSGTNFLQNTSRLTASSLVSPLPNSMRLAFRAQPFRSYRIERSADLHSWSTVDSITASDSAHDAVRDFSTTPSRGFFRIAVSSLTFD